MDFLNIFLEIANTKIDLNLLNSNQKPLEYVKSLLTYNLVETVMGPQNVDTFKMAVKVNGKIYYGCGSSKKEAKSNAAENILQSLKIESKTDAINRNNYGV